jgi:flagellar motor switch protein FliG
MAPIRSAPPDALAACLERETPCVVGLILRALGPATAEQVARFLPQQLSGEVALAIAHLGPPAPGTLQCLADALAGDIDRRLKRRSERSTGACCVARTLAAAEDDVALEALLQLGDRDPELALTVTRELERLGRWPLPLPTPQAAPPSRTDGPRLVDAAA